MFRGRRATGEIYSEELARAHPGRDWILTRILWLSGTEIGKNRLGDVDTMRRYIYIHGTPDSTALGVPGLDRLRADRQFSDSSSCSSWFLPARESRSRNIRRRVELEEMNVSLGPVDDRPARHGDQPTTSASGSSRRSSAA